MLHPLLTPWTPGQANDHCDTLLTKKFTAISDQQLQDNLTHPQIAPRTRWGTDARLKVRLVVRSLLPDAHTYCKCWVLASPVEYI